MLSKKYKSHIRKTKIGFYSIYKILREEEKRDFSEQKTRIFVGIFCSGLLCGKPTGRSCGKGCLL